MKHSMRLGKHSVNKERGTHKINQIFNNRRNAYERKKEGLKF